MTRFRLFAASLIGKIVRPLLGASARLLAGLPEAPSSAEPSCTEPESGALVPAPTFDEIASALHRFTRERAPLFPGEAVALALYVAAFSEAVAPSLARYLAAIAPPPPPLEPPSKDDVVN